MQSVTFAWRRYTEYQPPRLIRAAIAAVVIGIAGAVVGFLVGTSALALVMVALALMPVCVILPPRTKLEIEKDSVLVFRQPIHTNGLVWLTLIFAVMSIGICGQMVLGSWQVWRLGVVLPVAILATVFLATMAFKFRGPLRVSSVGVTFGNGSHFPFESSSVTMTKGAQGVPAIVLSSNGGHKRPVPLAPRQYNLDFNTLLSTLSQLQEWNMQGNNSTPAEIKAMLTATPPGGVEVGDTVQLTVPAGVKSGSA